MYCKKCGKLIADDSVFCKFCGANISNLVTSGTINQSSSPENKKSSTPSLFGWIFTIGFLILICYFIGSSGQLKEQSKSNTSNNSITNNLIEQPEPETGTILERTFQYEGGGHLIATAESNSAVITVVSIEDASQYLRFYVRKGETVDMSIPTGTYTITYKTGNAWYGMETEFGTFSQDGYFEDSFEFTFYQDNAWISNTIWEITV